MKIAKPAGALAVTALAAAAAIAAPGARAQGMRLTSPDISAGKPIGMKFVYDSFGCTGQNISPALAWAGAPAGTKSFALMLHDPDAPTGGAGFWHWVVVNIPASATGLEQGAGNADGAKLPPGAHQITTDYGSAAYGGPCPPEGDKPHRYDFTLYALKVDKLDLPANATASLAGFMVNANAIAKARLTAKFGRGK